MSDDGVVSDFGELAINGSELEKLRDGYKALLDEVDAFVEFLKNKSWKIELRHYRNDISHELEGVQKVYENLNSRLMRLASLHVTISHVPFYDHILLSDVVPVIGYFSRSPIPG